jgi:hypothetical protein
MTLSEVEAIVGGPARDETTGPVHAATVSHAIDVEAADALKAAELDLGSELSRARFKRGYHVWQSDQVIVVARMNDEGRLHTYTIVPVCRDYERPLDHIRRWLRL